MRTCPSCEARNAAAYCLRCGDGFAALFPAGTADRAAVETSLANLVHAYLQREIGRLMHQAEHWAAHGRPLAVHHRLRKAEAYYQLLVLFDVSRQASGWEPPFEQIRQRLAAPEINPPGAYPPSPDLYRYYDPKFAVDALRGVGS